jgi:microcystin-dependent protein
LQEQRGAIIIKISFVLVFLFTFISPGISYAQDEEIILTTYYPAPYGDYNMLTLEPMNGPPVDPAPNGAMYFDDGSHASRERGLYIYDSTDGGWGHAARRFGVPSGTVVMWSGGVASIPAGWALCNGGNGTPDLRQRFIVGAGGNNPGVPGVGYAVNAVGGANEVTLNVSQMPSHTHTGSTDSDGSHSHRLSGKPMSNINLQTGNMCVGYHRSGGDATTNHAGSHSHSISLNNTGGSQAHENRPPYYALCFIMKL